MQKPFKVTETFKDPAVIITVDGYFERTAGTEFELLIAKHLRQKHYFFIIDLTTCVVINSPGVATLLKTAAHVLEDFKGAFVINNPCPTNVQVLLLSGILPLAERTDSVSDALEICRKAAG